MNKKTLGVLLMGVSFFLASCVDDTYDLNKEITTDVESMDFKLALPVGSLKPFKLGTWFDGLDIIETMEDGVYAFAQRDTIAPIEKQPHEIIFNIPEQHIKSQIDVSEYMPEIPDIPNTTNLSDISALLQNIPNPIVIPFNESNTFSFKNPISLQYMYIESVILKEMEIITLNIKLDGLQALQESEVLMDFHITLPAIFNKVHSDDPTVSIENNRVNINKNYPLGNASGLTIELYCEEIHFMNEESNIGSHPKDGILTYEGNILTEGNVSIKWSETDLLNNIKGISEIGINVDCSLNPMHVQTFNGTFYDEFGKLEHTFTADLGEQINSLKESDNTITLSDPQIAVSLNNTISVPVNIDLDIVGKDLYGNPIASEEIHTRIPIQPAKYDDITGHVIPDTSKLYFTNHPHTKEGYENIIIENLGHLFENIPDSISVSIHPDINRNVPHHIDIDSAFKISAAYDILIPFKFDNLYISYSDTIAIGLGETMETFGESDLNLKMSITNSIPLELKLNFTALDENNEVIEDIVIAPITIAQGDGGSIYDEVNGKSKATLALNNSNGSLARLDKLKFEVEIQTDNASMGLKGIQGIQISDIVIEVAGKIDLKEAITDEDEETVEE